MVIFLLLFSSLIFAETQGTTVQMEISKQEFFQGEQVIAQFFAVSDQPQVEVEVVKFPEFKGYWSENQALRQGPIPMMPVYQTSAKPMLPVWGQKRMQGTPVKYKGLIGAYTLIPMIIKKEWVIEPMKVLVKGFSGQPDEVITHDIPPYKILPLPPLPSVFQTNLFFNAVGNFSVEMPENEVGFRDNEAAGIRITLTGQGNFQEIDNVPLSLPAIVEPVSNRSFTQVHAGNGQKSFEWDVIVHSNEEFAIEESGFYFFNPQSKKYEFAKIPKLHFTKLAPLPTLAPELSLQTRPIETQWTNAWDLKKNIFFWALQGLALLLLGITQFPKKKIVVKPSPKSTLKHLDNSTPKELYEVAIDLIEYKLERRVRHLTHKELIKSLSSELNHLALDLIPIIESYQYFGYSRDKISPKNPEALKEHFKSLMKNAA